MIDDNVNKKDKDLLLLMDEEIVEGLLDRYPFQSRDEIEMVWTLYQQQKEKENDLDAFCEMIIGKVGRRGPIHDLRILHQLATSSSNNVKKTNPTAQELLTTCLFLAKQIHSITTTHSNNNNNNHQPTFPNDIQHTDIDNFDVVCTNASWFQGWKASLEQFHSSNTNNKKNDDDGMPFVVFQEWVETQFPAIVNLSSTFYHLHIFGPSMPFCKGTRTMFAIPQFLSRISPNNDEDHEMCTSHFFSTPNEGNHFPFDYFLFSILCMEPQLTNKWLRLYTNEIDGCSFVSLHRCIAGYSGPTILLIRPKQNNNHRNDDESSFFGFFTTHGWKESKDYYGNSDCFLFYLSNQSTKIYRPKIIMEQQQPAELFLFPKKIPNDNFMYMSSSTTNNYGTTPYASRKKYGLAMGGTLENPRLFISDTFEGCMASFGGDYQDETFVAGPLLRDDQYCTTENFDIDVLEVWGIHNINFLESLQSRQNFMDQRDTQRRQAQQIKDKRVFLSDFQTGLYENNLYTHRAATRGRHEFSVDSEHGGYRLNLNNSTNKANTQKEHSDYEDHSDEDNPNQVHFTCLR